MSTEPIEAAWNWHLRKNPDVGKVADVVKSIETSEVGCAVLIVKNP